MCIRDVGNKDLKKKKKCSPLFMKLGGPPKGVGRGGYRLLERGGGGLQVTVKY